ncbi:hypothetical protein FACS1894200_10910 [Spirochaetia bacterium]|nr:hypothetical protein FACS1894200_10910 [Spirochaetia bacterium]
MKKVLFWVLTVITAGGVLAQENALSVDTIPLFSGFVASDIDANSFYFALSPAYEHLIKSEYSLGVRGDFIFGSAVKNVSVFYFGLSAHGRWYPLASGFEKLFLDVGLGFSTLSYGSGNGFSGLTIEMKAGWKHYMGPVYMEPSLAYFIGKSDGSNYFTPIPTEWQPGLALGIVF